MVVSQTLTWTEHIGLRLEKAYKVFHQIRRNCSASIGVRSKLDIYKSTVLSVISNASCCWNPNRGDMKRLELLQKRVTKWILPSATDYKSRLVNLELLPIPMYLQMLDILVMSKLCTGRYDVDISEIIEMVDAPSRENRQVPIVSLPKSELTYSEYFVRTTRLIRLLPTIDVTNPIGMKARLLRCFWQYFQNNYAENNLCSWRLGCRCSNSIN